MKSYARMGGIFPKATSFTTYLDTICADLQERGFVANRNSALEFLVFLGDRELWEETKYAGTTEEQNEWLSIYFDRSNVKTEEVL